MIRFPALLVPILVFSGCNKEATPSAPAPSEPAAAPAAAAKPAEPEPTAPAAAPTGSLSAADLAALVDGSAIAVNAAGDIAVFVTEEGDDQIHALRIHSGAGKSDAATFDFDANLDPAAFAGAHAAQLNAPLAGFQLVPGVRFSDATPPSAALPGVGKIAYDAKKTTLELDAGGKKTARKLDGGGVATPMPRAAFVLPGNKLVVTVRYKGDMVTTDALESFTF